MATLQAEGSSSLPLAPGISPRPHGIEHLPVNHMALNCPCCCFLTDLPQQTSHETLPTLCLALGVRGGLDAGVEEQAHCEAKSCLPLSLDFPRVAPRLSPESL